MSVVREVAGTVVAAASVHPLRVGIDGICGAGKSTFARTLVDELRALGHRAVHLDSDGFHQVQERRHQPGEPARVYYENAYDFETLAERTLRPLGPGGSRQYATKVHDLTTDRVVSDAVATAPADAVVVFDATFLQQPALTGLWDLVIYLHATEAAATDRGVARDAAALGGATAARAAYETRYMAACRIYLAERDPRRSATIVIDNTDPHSPVIERLPPHG